MSGPWRPIQTFVLLREGANVECLSSMLGALNVQVNGEEWKEKAGYALQPLKRIHLYGQQDYPGIEAFGNIQTVYVLSGIALFVLLIACVNFVNLTTRAVCAADQRGRRPESGWGWALAAGFPVSERVDSANARGWAAVRAGRMACAASF